MTADIKAYRWIGKRPIRPDGVDKVTGRARYGADFNMPGQIVGKVLRSPHAHARITSIDTSKSMALPGVRAVITAADMPLASHTAGPAGESPVNMHDLAYNILARGKVLYEGHAIAAVAATTSEVADDALALIEVEYDVLPHVIDAVEAMAPGAPILHDDLFTDGVTPKPNKPSNVAKRVEFNAGDVATGFEQADVIIERTFNTKPVHQGYIEPHACVASTNSDGQASLWTTTQGQFMVRAYCAELLGMEQSSLRVTPSEIGGGFGGKTVVYLEPLAVLLSRKAGRPVKMVMTREDVFRATGPTSGGTVKVKVGATRDGRITAGWAELYYQAGAFAGSQVGPGCMCAFAPYDIANVQVIGHDVVTNRPKVAAYRAPGAPISAYAVESVLGELAEKLGIDPLDLRTLNAAREGTKTAYGPTFGPIGFAETLEAARNHPHYKQPLGANQGRGVASGFWFNIGGESSATININADGTLALVGGNPDIGGSRAALAMMAAEVLGIDYNLVTPVVADTASVGFNFLTGGSRVTFASGMAVVRAAEDAVRELRERAAMIWDISPDAVEWEDGFARPSSPNAGEHEPLSLKQLAGMSAKTGGPITGHGSLNAQGAGPGFGTHICDVEVDRETGRVTVLRYTAIQDVGRAIHAAYVEGQLQGGAVQGIGWALNEEYVYNKDGCLENPGFLDYRMPVCSDLPMIDTVLVEVPNPVHPYGVRGVGEVPIVPPMAAVANAIAQATGKRLTELPMSPPRILQALNGEG
jgi:CO/xanthine dehydrogenase Mo-binding subunit